mmetsp:Transcript_967/g.2770  ORF Transcript_967/g.2770 Transcript_967/m.2770 type:complete len:223 (-) Transcript_967:661-1329(-)
MPSGVIDFVARKRNWMFGGVFSFLFSEEDDVTKPPWSQPGEVKGPLPLTSHLKRATGFIIVVCGIRSCVECDEGASFEEKCETKQAGWSWRFLPTPGRSATVSTLRSFKRDESPTPDSCRIWGDPIAPAVKMTSPVVLATALRGSLFSSVKTTSRPVAAPEASKLTLATAAPSMMSKLGRFRTSFGKYAEYADSRRPLRCETWNLPKPSCGRDQSLKSEFAA